jgi:hypothetical protein
MKLIIMKFSLVFLGRLSNESTGPRPLMNFRNKLIFYGGELLARRSTPML